MNTRQAGKPATAPSNPTPKVSDISVKRINRLNGAEGTLRAYCDLEVSGAFRITGVKVVEGKNGLFVSMPREQGKDGNWYDTVLPLSKEVRQQVSEVVLSAYQSER
jgi:stage V sporulation protein G